ncbi:MAG: DNA polymerase III subunit delta [Candidatus Portnoybacteria bacterium]|jgi:DNA polymerase-3 subunit delta|nr:DNA polymerase III subunit delta [Candidatus Portnoybacteria bacterium]
MIYFFYGPDTYRLREKVKEIKAKYFLKNSSGFNLGRFDFEEPAAWEKFKDFIQAQSMFAEKKLAVVENLLIALADTQEKVLEFFTGGDLAKTQNSFVVLAQELLPDEGKGKKTGKKYRVKNEKLWEFLTSKKVANEEFELLSGVRLEKWLKDKVVQAGGKISDSAAKKLAAYVGGDLWQQASELDKMLIYKNGEMISDKDVETFVRAKTEDDIFRAVDALAQRQKSAAFKLLRRQLAQGESEIALLGMLVYQFRNLLLVKEQVEKGVPFYQLSKKLFWHPFVLRKTFSQSQGFTLAGLKKIYSRLGELDVFIKSGRLEAPAALDLLIGEIAV